MTLEWLPGHPVNGELREFNHLCPGQGCAIEAYLQRQADREWFAAFDEDEKRPWIQSEKACE